MYAPYNYSHAIGLVSPLAGLDDSSSLSEMELALDRQSESFASSSASDDPEDFCTKNRLFKIIGNKIL